MRTNHISNLAKNLGGIISKNSPVILTSFAVAGLISTAVLAVRATPRAMLLLDVEKNYREEGCRLNETIEPLTTLDIIRIAWKCYIPAGAVGLATIFCIIGANTINLRRNAALASVYTITDTAFKEYQAKVVETLGRNKEQKVRDELSADRIKKNPPNSNEVIFTGKGEVLCYDSVSGRYFKSDIEQIRRAINELNRELMLEMFITLNELYYALDLSTIALGDDMGWNIDNGLIDVKFSSHLTEDGTPCLVLNYDLMPKFRKE